MIEGRPVLVTGAPRTGTTWLGRMLLLSGELGELYEPFNPQANQARWFDPPHHYLHIDETNERPFVEPIAQLARFEYPLGSRLRHARSPGAVRDAVRTARMVRDHRKNGRRVLVKDPLALFAAPWLAQRFDFRPEIVVRHPAGFVSSLLRIGWAINFNSWLRQPRLMETWLAPWRAEIEAAAAREHDTLLDGALFWKACTSVIAQYRAEHSDSRGPTRSRVRSANRAMTTIPRRPSMARNTRWRATARRSPRCGVRG